MFSYDDLKQAINTNNYCRKCINKEFRTFLKSKDCRYREHMHHCIICKQEKNIVTGVRQKSRWKLMFMKKPKNLKD